MEDSARRLRSRDVPLNPRLLPEPTERPAESTWSEGRRSRSHRSSTRGSQPSSRVLEEDMEMLAIREQLALEEQRAAVERQQAEASRQQAEASRLQEEADRQRQIAQLREQLIRREYEVRRNSISSRHSSAAAPSHRSESSDRRTTEWVCDQRQFSPHPEVPFVQPPPISLPVYQAPPISLPVYQAPVEPRTNQSNAQPSRFQQGSPLGPSVMGPQLMASEQPATEVFRQNQGCCAMDAYLTRKAAGNQLPIFTGEPYEWLNFITNFKRSTEVCKFSDDENLIRLQKSLAGRAKESVSALLCLPGSVEEVIKSLELQYGRPQVIIRSLFDKLRKFPKISEDRLNIIVDYYCKVNNLVISIGILNYEEYLSNPQFLEELVEKLTPNLKVQWGEHLVSLQTTKVNLKTFRDWLYNRSLAISLAMPMINKDHMDKKRVNTFIDNDKVKSDVVPNTCEFCSEGSHFIAKCHKFINADVDKRRDWVREKGLCFSCLGFSHRVVSCKSKRRCGVAGCKNRHHKLLHAESVKDHTVDTANQVVANSVLRDSNVLLKILPVCVRGPKGSMVIQALLDDGATATLLDKGVADTIGLKGLNNPLTVQWINGVTSEDDESEMVSLTVSGVGTNCRRFSLEGVRTLEGLTLPAPNVNASDLISKWPKVGKLQCFSYYNEAPKLLIGQDNWVLLECLENQRNAWNSLVVDKTRLGWVIHGNYDTTRRVNDPQYVHVCQVQRSADVELHDLVKESFSIDCFGLQGPGKIMSAEETAAVKIVEETAICRDNRWEVGLPWKNNTALENSRPAALKRLLCLEKKMDRDCDFASQYTSKIDDYISKGYARKLSPEEASCAPPKTWYLPHLAVFNPNKPGKIRVVFDASAKTRGSSLNDNLIKGPDLFTSIPGILIRFRKGKIAFGGDIKEMFLQIQIRPKDQDAQRFLWRGSDRSRDPDTYVMRVMLFGAVSSPFQAQEIRNRNANRFADEYPVAVKAITESHYMDDYLDSADSIEEAVQRITSVRFIHKSGGFVMYNWVSNSSEVLYRLGERIREDGEFNLDKTTLDKVLGMKWNSGSDDFIFQINYSKISPGVLSGERRPTKREILKIVMTIFDPLGFLSFFTIKAKILLQHIWRLKLDWDEPIGENLENKWLDWLNDFKEIEKLRIPRCYSYDLPTAIFTDIHVFCDSSDRAYSAVAYLRAEYSDGRADVCFVAGKSKVAPLKQLSVPRLELQAALIGTRLALAIKQALDLAIRRIVFWSDSKTVIFWIRNHERRYKMYVAHRLSEILEVSNPCDWRWAPGRDNAADGGTKEGRGINWRWLSGPDFLKQQEDTWPTESQLPQDEELSNTEIVSMSVSNTVTNTIPLPNIDRFSSWLKLIRATAWMCKFIRCCISKKRSDTGLNLEDISVAEKLWWKANQRENFAHELVLLKQNKPLPKSSKLHRLTPHLDSDGIIRIRGRIDNAPYINLDVKNPVILNSKSKYVAKMIDHAHLKAAHQGQEFVINELRQRFWILGMRRAVRSSWSRCPYCIERRNKPFQPQMGQLPASRLNYGSRPFSSSGLDYFGPLWVKNNRTKVKRYGVLFTCLTTRAVHLELATDLSTDCTLLAIRRFISRRGSPQELWSDNATNFRGAELEIKRQLVNINQSKVSEELLTSGVRWHFIPPVAPHMGGSWERMVRSVKAALKATLGNGVPREDVLHTVLLEIEHLLNSRPLTPSSDDPTDAEALTPNHFLIGSSSGSSLWNGEKRTTLQKRWQESQEMTKLFWRRWLREYLPSLVKSSRWFTKSPAACLGQLVYLPEKKDHGKWTRGVIVATYPGKDGNVRVVDVKTEAGVLRRAVTSLLPLRVHHFSVVGGGCSPKI